MKKVSGLTKTIGIVAIGAGALMGSFYDSGNADAGIIQWRNRVPAGEANPANIGSYTSTIEMGNGGTTGYDSGLDVDLDTSIVPNDKFLVTYVDHNPNKVEYEFTQDLQPGESYAAFLSFENNSTSGFAFTPNTVEFLAADGNFTYDLAVDTNYNGSVDTFRSGNVSDVMQGNGEVTPWNQLIFPGNDHRNGWFYGELTLTNNDPIPTGDFDSSGTVDSGDLVFWETGFGITGGAVSGDGDSDSDGDVDGMDFLTWQMQFGTTVSPTIAQGSEYAAVITRSPEPSSIALAGIGALGAYALSGRRGKSKS